jgi:hypothetical protein
MIFYYAAFETFWRHCRKAIMENSEYVGYFMSKNVFLSYYYKNMCNVFLSDKRKIGWKGTVIVDSGAHTFFSKHGIVAMDALRAKNKKHQDPYTYLNEYFKWVISVYNDIDFFVELDLQEILGKRFVAYQRSKAIELGIADKMISCYHTGDTMDEYIQMIAESKSKYVALQGLRAREKPIDYKTLIDYAYKHECRVHGFAFTRQGLLKQYPFYSVDSSSWKAVIKFGSVHVFDGLGIKSVSGIENIIQETKGIHSTTYFRDIPNEIKKVMHSIKEYDKLEEFITKFWKIRGIEWR